jgi:hypothetical protein
MVGYNGGWDVSTRELYTVPAIITGATVTDVEVKYDPLAKTIAMTLSRDGIALTTHTVVMPNTLAEYAQDGYAYVAFGGGTGGSKGNMLIRDFALTYDAPVTSKPERLMCGGVEVPADAERTITLDTSVQDAPVLISALTMEDGATLRLSSATGGQLRFADTTLGAAVSCAPATDTTLVLDNTIGGSITQQGQGVLKLNGTCDALRLASGTLALDAPTLTRATDLYVTIGATLALDFTGKQYIHALTVDGIAQKGGVYTRNNTTWITGDGILVVTYPPNGTLILVK